MSLYKFILGQKTTMSKEEILGSISETTQIIQKYTLPATQAAAQLWKGQKFKSAISRDIQETIQRSVKNKPIFELMASTMQNTLDLLDTISTYADSIFYDREANIALSFAKATTMRLVQAAELSNVYTRRLINYIYWLECGELNGQTHGPKEGEVKWLEENMSSYTVAMHALQKDKDQMLNTLKNLPDSVVTSTTEMTFTHTKGLDSVDPFGLNQLSVRWNPFYLLGMLVAEWQAERFRQAQDELKLLEYRRIQLEKLRDKTQDAKLDQEIEYLQDRITGMYAKIDKMEKTYHV